MTQTQEPGAGKATGTAGEDKHVVPPGSQQYEVAERVVTPASIVWRRFRKNKLALFGLCLLSIMVVLCFGAQLFAPYDRDVIDLYNIKAPPSDGHWMGTDHLGRDILSRLLYGGQISLSVGLVAVSINVLLGIVFGSLAGYYGGSVDNVIMRLGDIVLSFPFLPLALTVMAIRGPSIYNVMLVLGVLGWVGPARLVRGEFLSLRERDFVEAARSVGSSDFRLMLRHLLPNAFAPLVVAATLGVATAILIEAVLSFLGMGVRQPIPSWGNMLTQAQSLVILRRMPWMWLPPGVAIFVAVLSINFLGDGLRDAMDPRLRD